MIEYTWKITRLEYFPQMDNLEKVVNKIHWILIGVDGQYGTSLNGVETLKIDILDPLHYTAYENLTENQVIDWLVASMGERVQLYQNEIAKRIEAAKTPAVVAADPPWA